MLVQKVKTALVTGGAGGIGSAICKTLAEAGFVVCVGYNASKIQAENLCREIQEKGFCAYPVEIDISSSEKIKKAVAQAEKITGKITLLVNNGGISDIGLYTDLTDERLLEIMNVNLLGAMRLTKEILPGMISRHYGKIVNITSVWGEKGASCEVAYSAAKAGLIGFTKALAREEALSGINVNCISCGFIDTKMNGELSEEEKQAVIEEIPCEKPGLPEDVANAVNFLADDKSSYINGQVIRVDGGWI